MKTPIMMREFIKWVLNGAYKYYNNKDALNETKKMIEDKKELVEENDYIKNFILSELKTVKQDPNLKDAFLNLSSVKEMFKNYMIKYNSDIKLKDGEILQSFKLHLGNLDRKQQNGIRVMCFMGIRPLNEAEINIKKELEADEYTKSKEKYKINDDDDEE